MKITTENQEIEKTNVSNTVWYCDYVKTAVEYKLISGYGNGKFSPNDQITREQAMTMIARAMNITGLDAGLSETEAATLCRPTRTAPALQPMP